MKKIVVILTFFAFVPLSLAEELAEDGLDYGDYTSVTLQVKSWDALGEGKYEDAVRYTEKCTELYEEKAREMQASLSAKPSSDVAHDYWALNDVGTCYFIRGEALMKLKKNAEAIAAFKVVRDELYYSQAWDPKGWFWSPSDAAYPRIEMLEAKTKNDF
ncbi:MAG: beta-glucanase precursor [Gammaproteobacteria bacterium]|nr:beta-glucanase precursor [Gammaproteobacteria bacterium]NNL45337.1 beta-glucanase precursor [Woeseiaceae bacterium]